MCTAELTSWLHDPDLHTFPFDAVVRQFHAVGKHFVATELLDLLGDARDLLPTLSGPWPQLQTLAAFLDTALDKPEGRYDYPTYLALSLLRLPGVDDPAEQAPFARSRCDRLVAQLVTDALAFELTAIDGCTTMLPGQRPTADLLGKRFRHALRAIAPAMARMSLDGALLATDPVGRARQACAAVRSDMSLAERRAVDLSILPVHVTHDEYLFLRTLQTFESTFALLAVQLRTAVTAMADRDVDTAAHFLAASRLALAESAPLFSMLATMQVESFRTFRDFTEGASAIQSRNYKIVESLCRVPDGQRLDSPAYLSVPDVRGRVLSGQATLDEAFGELRDSGDVPDADVEQLAAAMSGFAGALLRWRQTHYRLAVRMLGQATGTGYTEGTPYLATGRAVPVFRTVGTSPGCEPATPINDEAASTR